MGELARAPLTHISVLTARQESQGCVIIIEPPAGSALNLAPGTIHRIEAIDDVVLFEVSMPDADDGIRIEDRYGRAQ